METLFYTVVIIICLVFGFQFISDLVIIDFYQKEARMAIVNSVSESFGELSLENLSLRNSEEMDDRTIGFTDTIKNRLMESLKTNLELDDSLTPKAESFISDREAIKIRNITLVKSSMIPYDHNGLSIMEESMIVEIDLPIDLSTSKSSKWIKISEVISLDTFLTSKER